MADAAPKTIPIEKIKEDPEHMGIAEEVLTVLEDHNVTAVPEQILPMLQKMNADQVEAMFTPGGVTGTGGASAKKKEEKRRKKPQPGMPKFTV